MIKTHKALEKIYKDIAENQKDSLLFCVYKDERGSVSTFLLGQNKKITASLAKRIEDNPTIGAIFAKAISLAYISQVMEQETDNDEEADEEDDDEEADEEDTPDKEQIDAAFDRLIDMLNKERSKL